jgi:hypothetical protein
MLNQLPTPPFMIASSFQLRVENSEPRTASSDLPASQDRVLLKIVPYRSARNIRTKHVGIGADFRRAAR